MVAGEYVNMSVMGIRISKIQLLIVLVLLAGLLITLSVVGQRQVLKTRADVEIFNSISVTGANCGLPEAGHANCQMDENANSVTIDGIQGLKNLPPPD